MDTSSPKEVKKKRDAKVESCANEKSLQWMEKARLMGRRKRRQFRSREVRYANESG